MNEPAMRLLSAWAEGVLRVAWLAALGLGLGLLLAAFDIWRADFGAGAVASLWLAVAALVHGLRRLAVVRRVLAEYRWPEVLAGDRSMPVVLGTGAALGGALLGAWFLAADVERLPVRIGAGAACDLTLSVLVAASRRLDAFLERFEPARPEAPLLAQRPNLNARVQWGRAARRATRLAALLVRRTMALAAMLTARWLRLRDEATYHCRSEGCQLEFEDPPLACRCSGHGSLQTIRTWPFYEAPLFAVCPACRTVHYTWWPATRAIKRKTAHFHNTACLMCRREEPDGRRRFRALLVCLGTRELPEVLTRMERWFGPENLEPKARQTIAWSRGVAGEGWQLFLQSPPFSARFESRRARRCLQVDFTQPDEVRRWAGDHDWVIVLPRSPRASQEVLEKEIRFALGQLELPLARGRAAHSWSSRSTRFHRLFGDPQNPPRTVFQTRLHTRLAMWAAMPEPLEHRGRPVVPVIDDGAFESFLEDAL